MKFFTFHTFPKLKSAAIGFIALAIVYRQIVPLNLLIRNFPLNDYSVFVAGVKAAAHRENPYRLWFFDRYNYSPAATLLFWPLILPSENHSEYLITIASILCLWFTVRHLIKLHRVSFSRSAALLLFALTLTTFPVKLTLALGQVNLIVLYLLIAAFYLSTQKRAIPAGILLGLATVIKLTPGPLVIYYLLQKKYPVVWSWFATVGLLSLVSLVIFGWPLTHDYYFRVLPGLALEVDPKTLLTSYMNQSLTALLGRWGIFNQTNYWFHLLFSLAALLLLLFKFAQTKNLERQTVFFSLLLILTLIFSPVFVWQHHYVFVLPAWLSLALSASRKPSAAIIAVVGFTYLLLKVYFKNPLLPSQQSPLIATHFLSSGLLLFLLCIFFYSKRSSSKSSV